MPTKVYVEENAVANHKEEWTALGTKAMIITGKYSSRKNGSLDDVIAVLDEKGIGYAIYDEIEENPSVETIVKASKCVIEEGADFVIGLGGGSPMDAAKAIAVLSKHPDQVECARTFLYEPGLVEGYPLVEIPTTSGTGSEVTPYAILTLHDSNTKQGISKQLFAEYALVDYRYLKTSGYSNLVNTCVDALAHLLESYLNTNANEMNRMYSKEGLKVWGEVKDQLLTEETVKGMTDRAYERFMEASVLAGMAITHTGTSVPHGFSYMLTYALGLPHGKAVGIFLPAFLSTYDAQEEVKDVLDFLGFEDVDAFTDYISQLFGKVTVEKELFEKDAVSLTSNAAKLKNYPYKLTEEKIAVFAKVVCE